MPCILHVDVILAGKAVSVWVPKGSNGLRCTQLATLKHM